MQVEPANDAVLGLGQRLLDLQGGIIRVQVPAEGPDQGQAEINRRDQYIRAERRLPNPCRHFKRAVHENHAQAVKQRQDGEAQERGSDVEQSNPLPCLPELSDDDRFGTSGRGWSNGVRDGGHRKIPRGERGQVSGQLYLDNDAIAGNYRWNLTRDAAKVSPTRQRGKNSLAGASG